MFWTLGQSVCPFFWWDTGDVAFCPNLHLCVICYIILKSDIMTGKLLILIICIIGLLLISPLSAKEVTAKVDDKRLLIDDNRDMFVGTLHTCYGEITVSNEDYNNIIENIAKIYPKKSLKLNLIKTISIAFPYVK